MGVTIKDIARLAGVSHTTVSRALNDSPLINADTKQRIRDLARTLDYTPNVSARSLVLDRSYNIGLFFSTLETGTSSAFLHDVVRGVNSRVKYGYNIVLKGIDDYEAFTSVTPKHFDGIIVMSQSEQDDAFIRMVQEKRIPQVVLNRSIDLPGVCNILSDDYAGAYRLVQYMIDKGHRRIALIEGKQEFRSAVERSSGYANALEANGLRASDQYRMRGNYDLESGYEAMRGMLTKDPLPTAVFCANDDMAVGAVKAVLESGLSVPEDISIAGFDDNLFSRYMTPALTTVRRPIEEISRLGAETMMRIINQKQTSCETIRMDTSLVIRDSVGKCRS